MNFVFIYVILINIHVLFALKIPKVKEEIISSLHHVSDGDTMTVLAQNGTKLKIRMAFIDAPEITQQFGHEAKLKLLSLIKDEKYFKVYRYSGDSYNRVLGMISKLDGTDLNKLMIKEGYAWCFRNRCPKEYKDLLNNAKSQKLGLWKFESPIKPWTFRKNENKKRKALRKLRRAKRKHQNLQSPVM